ncbi:hypothetical protein BOFL111202_18775 [Bordetella flabilis]
MARGVVLDGNALGKHALDQGAIDHDAFFLAQVLVAARRYLAGELDAVARGGEVFLAIQFRFLFGELLRALGVVGLHLLDQRAAWQPIELGANADGRIALEIDIVEMNDEGDFGNGRGAVGIGLRQVTHGQFDIGAALVEQDVRVQVIAGLRRRYDLAEIRLDGFPVALVQVGIHLAAVAIGFVHVAAVVGGLDEGDLDGYVDGERLGSRQRFGVLGFGVRRFRDVDEFRDAELGAGFVDVGLPAKIGADILHLDADLAHFAAQFVVDQLLAVVRQDIALAGGVGGFGDDAQRALVVLADFGGQLVRLLPHPLVRLFARGLLGGRHIEAGALVGGAPHPLLFAFDVGAEFGLGAVVGLDGLRQFVLRGGGAFGLDDGLRELLRDPLGVDASRADLDELDGGAGADPDMADGRPQEGVELEEVLAKQMDDADGGEADTVQVFLGIDDVERILVGERRQQLGQCLRRFAVEEFVQDRMEAFGAQGREDAGGGRFARGLRVDPVDGWPGIAAVGFAYGLPVLRIPGDIPIPHGVLQDVVQLGGVQEIIPDGGIVVLRGRQAPCQFPHQYGVVARGRLAVRGEERLDVLEEVVLVDLQDVAGLEFGPEPVEHRRVFAIESLMQSVQRAFCFPAQQGLIDAEDLAGIRKRLGEALQKSVPNHRSVPARYDCRSSDG